MSLQHKLLVPHWRQCVGLERGSSRRALLDLLLDMYRCRSPQREFAARVSLAVAVRRKHRLGFFHENLHSGLLLPAQSGKNVCESRSIRTSATKPDPSYVPFHRVFLT